MCLRIDSEIALVVGASEGIGYAGAKALLEEGAEVLICSRSANQLKSAAASLKQATGRDARWFAADVTCVEDAQKLKAWVERETTHLDNQLH